MSGSTQTLWTLIALASLGIAAAFVWLRQRANGWPGRRATSMRIVESLSLGPRERLVMVEVAGQKLLLGVTAQSVQCVHAARATGSSAENAELRVPEQESFDSVLARESARAA